MLSPHVSILSAQLKVFGGLFIWPHQRLRIELQAMNSIALVIACEVHKELLSIEHCM